MIPPRRRGQRDRVEAYLARLAPWLPRCARADLLAEARRHLYDATLRGQQAGLDRQAAQRRAIAAFGPAWRVGLAARRAYDSPLLALADGLLHTFRRRPATLVLPGLAWRRACRRGAHRRRPRPRDL